MMKLSNYCHVFYRNSTYKQFGPNIRRYSTAPPQRRIANYENRLEVLLEFAKTIDPQIEQPEWVIFRNELHQLITAQPVTNRRRT